ncbi:hypothetical protein HDU67_001424 [Dinochytrium kinnereticum]|nr:hypothetical protein HDU67_001424 [Dinochytrium kinnereticum]
MERKETNASFYRRKVSAKDILSGHVPPPPAAEELYRALNRRSHLPEDEDDYHHAGGAGDRRPSASSTYSSNGQWPDNRKPNGSTEDNRFGRSDTYSGGASSGRAIPARPPPPRPFDNSEKAVALYDFNGERDGDLSFRKGDLVVIVRRDPSEWWTGKCNGREAGTAGLTPEEATSSNTPLSYAVPIDPSLIDDIEREALTAARDLDGLMKALEYRIGEMTNLTLQSVNAHGKAAVGLVKQMNHCTQATVKLITAVDELSHDMGGVQTLSEQSGLMGDWFGSFRLCWVS